MQYDMLTFPITTPHFHSRVLSMLSSTFSGSSGNHETLNLRNVSSVSIGPLSPADTNLTPDDSISSIIGVTSTWTDLGSPDPVIADISHQVLKLELAYAAFCGVSYVIVPGPRPSSTSDIASYARAILEGLNQGPYMQLYIWVDTHSEPKLMQEQVGDLAAFSRDEYHAVQAQSTEVIDEFRIWQAWDTVRSVCKYSTRLCLGML